MTRQEKLRLERVRVLYSNARFSIAGLFASALFFSLFLWHNVSESVWLAWLIAIVLINLLRLLLIETFHKRLRLQEIGPHNVVAWERRFSVGILFSSLSWGIVSLFPFQQDLLPSLLYTALILIAMSSASIFTLITSLPMGLTFLSATMLPLITRCILVAETPCYILALACLTYYIIFTQMACRLHYAIIDNINLKFENEELSLKDALTGLWNRRQLYLFVEQLQSRGERSGESFSVILMDLDRFKDYNDTRGHNAGDELLVKVAEIIVRESRDEDLAVRYGGEEFMVVLPRADLQQASRVAERIRKGVEQQTGISVSAGIAGFEHGEGFGRLTARADKALYQAKSQGRNQVVTYSTPHGLV
ncbi:MAG: GGDEF domain-containing protein [Gammaproteobacteria bacterium]|nr:GGDEF domain-containing protein [Gammaproteobacteria bacterium]